MKNFILQNLKLKYGAEIQLNLKVREGLQGNFMVGEMCIKSQTVYFWKHACYLNLEIGVKFSISWQKI